MKVHRAWKILFFSLLVIVLILGYFANQFTPSPQPAFGISFSAPYAEYLGFDPMNVYLDILNDLQPKKIRLMAYWEMIEPTPRLFTFDFLDKMLVEAQQRQVEIILVVGEKQPRWPECHRPGWVNDLSVSQREEAELSMIRQAVEHFKPFTAIKIWQIGNEPFFAFGLDCQKTNKQQAQAQIALVKGLDDRPVMVTDSGEKGLWIPTARLGADIFGSTMYRVVNDHRFGYVKYPIPPVYFRIKAGILKVVAKQDRIIGVELQAEPWFSQDLFQTDLSTQLALMNPKIFAQNIDYARRVGFEENYLWGAEWWYWLAKKQRDFGMWATAKELLRK